MDLVVDTESIVLISPRDSIRRWFIERWACDKNQSAKWMWLRVRPSFVGQPL